MIKNKAEGSMIRKTYNLGREFRLTLYNEGQETRDGKLKIRYRFSENGKAIFTGDNFRAGYGMTSPKRIACDLLAFLTLRPGDTDPEFFEDYTLEQLEFSRRSDMEYLQAEFAESLNVEHL